jgi:hypothetical protein
METICCVQVELVDKWLATVAAVNVNPIGIFLSLLRSAIRGFVFQPKVHTVRYGSSSKRFVSLSGAVRFRVEQDCT